MLPARAESKVHVVKFSYKSCPTIREFSRDNSFIRGLMGPFGSGKSSGCVAEIIRRSLNQAPSADGTRYTRWGVVRNTYVELRDTTIKTFLDWYPPEIFGSFNQSTMTYTITGIPGCHIEILFRALDKPSDLKKLLSLELTGAWVNEAREVPKAIIDGLTGRVGRFPSMKDGVGCTWSGVFLDTNPPDDDHWWYEMFEEPESDEEEVDDEYAFLEQDEDEDDIPPSIKVFKQPSGLSPEAENLPNLKPRYYQEMAVGKTREWKKVYIHGQYGSVQDGKAIYAAEWNDSIHINPDLKPIKGVPLVMGVDFGLTPALIIGQVSSTGQLLIHDELVATRIGLTRFFENVVKPFLVRKYRGFKIEAIIGDPAGVAESDRDERDAFQLIAETGFQVQPASTNNRTPRWEAVKYFLMRYADKKPAFQMHPRCKVLRKGFNGGYRLRRLQISGEERFESFADKNRYSHPHDGLQYLSLYAKGEDFAMADDVDESELMPDYFEDF